MEKPDNNIVRAAIVAGFAVVVVLVVGTFWMGRSVADDTRKAVHAVSMLYLDELAGRREQVIAANLASNIRNLDVAISLMDESDTSDAAHLRAYQSEIKQLYYLERFAFVNEDGVILTSTGTQDDIEDYPFDPYTIEAPEISVLNLTDVEKKVIIARPVTGLTLEGKRLIACFMQINMVRMLEGVSLQSENTGTTFCNI